MELQQLIYFQCLAKTGHMGNASKLLYLTQPAISISIKKLEDELEVPLFKRYKKSFILTKYGRTYLQHVEAALHELEEGAQKLQNMLEIERNRVTVMFPYTIMTSEFMENLYREAPNIIVNNLHIDHTLASCNLHNGSLDMCMLSHPIEGEGITFAPLKEQELVVITSPSHKLACWDEIFFEELANEQFAAYSEELPPRQSFETICHIAGFVPKIAFESRSIRDMLKPIRAGKAIVLASIESIGDDNVEDLHIIHLKDRKFTTPVLAFREGDEQKGLVGKLYKVIMESHLAPASPIIPNR